MVAALDGGPRSTDQVVATVYPDLEPALWPLAAQSADAHLRKLVDDGRVERRGEEWASR